MRRLIAVLPVLVLLCVASCANASIAKPRIVGGSVSTTSYPAQALVLITVGSSRYMCGGTLVAPTKVVTAAHCLDGANIGDSGSTTAPPQAVPASALAIYLGSNVQLQGTRYAASDAVIEPDYDAAAYSSDAGVITLSTAATQAPLPLADPVNDAAALAAGQTARVIGWGTTRSGGTSSSSLREVDIPIVSDATCSRIYGSSFTASVMTCAGASGKDACQGDSGGPLMVSTASGYALAGIVSWGYGCATPGYDGVYTEATSTHIRSWLLEQIATTGPTANAAPAPGTPAPAPAPTTQPTTPVVTAPAVTVVPAVTPVPATAPAGRAVPTILATARSSSHALKFSGRVLGGSCRNAKLKVTVSHSGHSVARRTLALSSNCSFRATLSVRGTVRVRVAFTGSAALLPATKTLAARVR